MRCLFQPHLKCDGLIILILLFCHLLCVNYVDSKQPNIIFIVADDLGWGDVGFHGGNDIPTPNIDALAYNGIVLNRHYSQPTCTPSRAALLTGKYPNRLGIVSPFGAGEPNVLPITEKLLPQYLKELGYTTNLIGKWHVGCKRDEFLPTSRGYDHHTGYMNGYLTYNDSRHISNKACGLDARQDNKPYASEMSSKYLTDFLTDEAIEVIHSHNQSSPLFLQISHAAVHTAYADKGKTTGVLQVPNEEENEKMFSHIENKDRRMFAGMLTSLDNSIGKIIESLRNKQMLGNSIIIFIADNGGVPVDNLYFHANAASNWPLRGEKYSVYEGGIRTVAAVWSPLLKKNQVINNQIHLTDWLPTLYYIAGGDMEMLPKELDGYNQWNALNGTLENEIREPILVAILPKFNDEALIFGDWKLIKVNASSDINFSHIHYGNANSGKQDYDPHIILKSETNGILSTYLKADGRELTKDMIEYLRKSAIIKCSPKEIVSENCIDQYCLYNIKEDPCEYKNVAPQNSAIVEKISTILQMYKREMENIPLQVKPYEEISNPIYWGGYWSPWKEDNIKLCVNEAIVALAAILCLLMFINYFFFKNT